jgi:hypothetical protein
VDRHTPTDRCEPGWVSLAPAPHAHRWRHVATITLARGMLRMVRCNGLLNRLDAVEPLARRV